MKKAKVGNVVPDITLEATGGKTLKLSELKGRNVVLYFYPKDDTPGCTTEGQDFRAAHKKFQRLDTEILGVSRDSIASHEKFKEKLKFPFDLVSDPDEKLCRAFDVIREKKLYGKTYMGVDRSTFVIDGKGVLRKEFRGVKVKGHVDEVLEAVKAL
jgi:peroxiredoxin Q/BCP